MKKIILLILMTGCSTMGDFLSSVINGKKNESFEFYRQDDGVKIKRFKGTDFVDQDKEVSLWIDNDYETSLHFKTKEKKVGDIVSVGIQDKMKKIILQELRRSVLPKVVEGDETALEMYLDKMPGVITEKMNDELIIKGRKNILYDNYKKMVQIEGLVSRDDFSDNVLESDKFIEFVVTVR